jgi:hypothetical protein
MKGQEMSKSEVDFRVAEPGEIRLALEVKCPFCDGKAYRPAHNLIVCLWCGLLTGKPKSQTKNSPPEKENG